MKELLVSTWNFQIFNFSNTFRLINVRWPIEFWTIEYWDSKFWTLWSLPIWKFPDALFWTHWSREKWNSAWSFCVTNSERNSECLQFQCKSFNQLNQTVISRGLSIKVFYLFGFVGWNPAAGWMERRVQRFAEQFEWGSEHSAAGSARWIARKSAGCNQVVSDGNF